MDPSDIPAIIGAWPGVLAGSALGGVLYVMLRLLLSSRVLVTKADERAEEQAKRADKAEADRDAERAKRRAAEDEVDRVRTENAELRALVTGAPAHRADGRHRGTP